MSPLSPERFQPPGPGQWAADPSHHPRPITALYAYGLGGIQRGQEAGSARYGMLVAGARIAVVEGFVYGQPNLVAVRPPGDDESARRYFDAYVPTDPDLRRCPFSSMRSVAARVK